MARKSEGKKRSTREVKSRIEPSHKTPLLWDEHERHLENSGLTAQTLAKSYVYSGTEKEVQEILGFQAGTGLVFPYPNCGTYARVKLDRPGGDGKRYRSPQGSRNHLYIPTNLDSAVLGNPARPLFITEGEKKALKACQEALPTVAIAGVWAWRTNPTGEDSRSIPDLDTINWVGRTVYLVFDSDLQTNENVRRAESALAQELARRRATVFAVRLPNERSHKKVGLDDYLVQFSVKEFHSLEQVKLADPPTPLGLSAAEFLVQQFPPADVLVDGLLSSDGSGWIGGEEKLGKTFYALEEALCLALKLPVCGKFSVPTPTNVLFIEEEDPPQRVQRRLHALIRGHGRSPEDPAVKTALNKHFQLAVWQGFSLDRREMVARLEASLIEFRPRVVYLDVLRKLTHQDLNKANEASALLETLDELRRKHDVIFRVVHHYRKGQGGHRSGRGSQEISGSYVLGAWGENSLFFTPIGKAQGTAKVDVQRKDAAALPPFKLVMESSGEKDSDNTTVMRLVAHDIDYKSQDAELKEKVYDAIQSCSKTDPVTGRSGVTVPSIRQSLKCSEKPIREALKALVTDKRIYHAGTGMKNVKLWDIRPNGIQE